MFVCRLSLGLVPPCPLALPALQVVLYRWNVYNVFLQVPSAVIRTLATRVLALLEDGIGGDAPTNEGEPREVSASHLRFDQPCGEALPRPYFRAVTMGAA